MLKRRAKAYSSSGSVV